MVLWGLCNQIETKIVYVGWSQMPFGLMVLWGEDEINFTHRIANVVSNAFRLNGSVGATETHDWVER